MLIDRLKHVRQNKTPRVYQWPDLTATVRNGAAKPFVPHNTRSLAVSVYSDEVVPECLSKRVASRNYFLRIPPLFSASS